MLYNYIAIEGNIGAGKTALATRLSQELNTQLVLEEYADNPFLPPFYQDPNKYAFQLELSFLAERYQQLVDMLRSRNLFQQDTISDYLIHKSLIFSKINLDKQTYELYFQLYSLIIKSMPKPDLVIYLNNNTDRLLSNIAKRGREYEQSINADYLKRIDRSYFQFFRRQKKMRILNVNASELDFIAHESDYHFLKSLLKEFHPAGITPIDPQTARI